MFIWRNEHMKKITTLAVSLLITASVFAQDGIIAWSTYKDTNSGGSSTANIVTEEKTILFPNSDLYNKLNFCFFKVKKVNAENS